MMVFLAPYYRNSGLFTGVVARFIRYVPFFFVSLRDLSDMSPFLCLVPLFVSMCPFLCPP